MRLLVLLLCLFVAPAWAEDARKIDFTTELLGLNGKPIVDPKAPPDAPPFTLGEVAAASLMNVPPGENPSGIEKVRRLGLALKIQTATAAELSQADITLIMDLINKSFPTLVSARAWLLLDPTLTKEFPK